VSEEYSLVCAINGRAGEKERMNGESPAREWRQYGVIPYEKYFIDKRDKRSTGRVFSLRERGKHIG